MTLVRNHPEVIEAMSAEEEAAVKAREAEAKRLADARSKVEAALRRASRPSSRRTSPWSRTRLRLAAERVARAQLEAEERVVDPRSVAFSPPPLITARILDIARTQVASRTPLSWDKQGRTGAALRSDEARASGAVDDVGGPHRRAQGGPCRAASPSGRPASRPAPTRGGRQPSLRSPGERADRCQVRATWREGAVPDPSAGAAPSPRALPATAPRSRPGTSGDPEFQVQAFDRDDETLAAIAAWKAGDVFMRVDPAGVEFGGDPIPLVIGHDAGTVMVDDLEVAQTGREFSAVGWVSAEQAEVLSGYLFFSPSLVIVRARLEEIAGLRFAEATQTVLVELSATNDPARDGTSLAVGPPGKTLWPRPTGERFTRIDTGRSSWPSMARSRRSDMMAFDRTATKSSPESVDSVSCPICVSSPSNGPPLARMESATAGHAGSSAGARRHPTRSSSEEVPRDN